MISLLAQQMNPEHVFWTFVVGQVVIIAGMIIKAFVDHGNRVQDRLDRESAVKLQLAEGERRKVEIVAATDKTHAMSSEALRVANGHNEKIKHTMEAVKEIVNAPREVIVVNPPDRPVHTTKDLQAPTQPVDDKL